MLLAIYGWLFQKHISISLVFRATGITKLMIHSSVFIPLHLILNFKNCVGHSRQESLVITISISDGQVTRLCNSAECYVAQPMLLQMLSFLNPITFSHTEIFSEWLNQLQSAHLNAMEMQQEWK